METDSNLQEFLIKREEEVRQRLSPELFKIYKKFSHKPASRLMGDIKTSLTKELLLKKLEEAHGNASAACRACLITRRTYENYMLEDPLFYALVQEIKESNIDFAEDKLRENIERNYEASIIFYLKTQGRKRGYSESAPAEQEDLRLKAQIARMSNEQIETQILELRSTLGLSATTAADEIEKLEPGEKLQLEENNDVRLNQDQKGFNDIINREIEKIDLMTAGVGDGIDSLFETEEERMLYLLALEKEQPVSREESRMIILHAEDNDDSQ